MSRPIPRIPCTLRYGNLISTDCPRSRGAEAVAVWLNHAELVVNALAVLSQHLVVLPDPGAIVDAMQDTYGGST